MFNCPYAERESVRDVLESVDTPLAPSLKGPGHPVAQSTPRLVGGRVGRVPGKRCVVVSVSFFQSFPTAEGGPVHHSLTDVVRRPPALSLPLVRAPERGAEATSFSRSSFRTPGASCRDSYRRTVVRGSPPLLLPSSVPPPSRFFLFRSLQWTAAPFSLPSPSLFGDPVFS